MLSNLGLVAMGFVALTIGGELALRGAVGLAIKLGVSTAIIGLTVVGFGTSAPELMVAIKAALADKSDIALGNVVGSNIANILLIVGVGGAITLLTCRAGTVHRDATATLVATLALVALAWTDQIAPWQGAVMVAALVCYMAWSYQQDRKETANAPKGVKGAESADGSEDALEEAEDAPTNMLLILFYIGVGLVGLIGGAHLLVEGAVAIARDFGVPESVIGLTLIAVGTSLPELAATIAAALRKHVDLAIGNVLGSCLFNILLILGVTSMVNPLEIASDIKAIDLWVMLGATVALLVILRRGYNVTRIESALLLAAYIAYMTLIAFRLEVL